MGRTLYHNRKWVEKVEEHKYTFGGHEVSFKVVKKRAESVSNCDISTVEVTCKGETGTHWQIEEILKNYFRPCKFGNVEVKSFKLSGTIMYLDGKIDVINPKFDINNVKEITIGCLTGTYKELYDIYQHCLTLLK